MVLIRVERKVQMNVYDKKKKKKTWKDYMTCSRSHRFFKMFYEVLKIKQKPDQYLNT